ncbi:glycosyltransferase family 4 protein [Hymenobacter sp. BT770]|uniref:glycosyltransferase family 4 protein n=1 Tax=Hymenobacter sp. BT770 TaxID=2886942 RepID=UPI001D11E56C|nr:glycosyltransferase family 4 protein [Hymenobacter sp. BT770]MCC3153805.1 glycosyltransferase family 4 protein [Hymenobacter sp. BT770]MDO3415949.1 glycosyltransferase family 4 protein [Hymenobacter sp. BT770]
MLYDTPEGGSEVLWARTAARALAEGHKVMVSAYAWPELPGTYQQLGQAGATLFFRSRYEGSLRYRALSWLRRLPRGGVLPEVRALAEFNPDVVVVSQGGWIDLYYHNQLAEWLRKVPFVLVCHNYNDPARQRDFSRSKVVTLFGHAKEVLMISDKQLRTIQRQLVDPIANARVIQNPLNLPATYPLIHTPATDGIARLSVVASFDVDRKGHDVLLEALTAPQWAHRRFCVNFYGQGPDREYLKELIRFYGLEDHVQLCGYFADAASLWQNTDLVVIPSRIESGPMVLQEAMLCGLPVVAADVGIVRDWLDDEETGFIADTASAISLNKALDRAWSRRAEWSDMGALAATRTLPRLEIDPVGSLLKRLISIGNTSVAPTA